MKVPVVSVGRYCILEDNCIIRPPSRPPAPLPSLQSFETEIRSQDTNSNEPVEDTEQLKKENEERMKLKQEQDNQISPETGRIHFPIKVGSCVYIGANTVVEAAQIGSCVYIGKNCKIGEFAIIKDCVYIEDGTVIPSYVSISSFSRVSGNPCQLVDELPESTEQVLEGFCRKVYAGIDVGGAPL